MKRTEITYNDVLENELSVVCRLLTSSIIPNVVKREGYDKNKNNHHVLTDNEKYIFHLFELISNIESCLSSIESSNIFVKRFYGKEYYKEQKINIIDYSLYHYDVLCCKISTLKDLYLKLINHIYSLSLIEKECTWANIKKHKNEINNSFLFSLLTDYHGFFEHLEKKRNKSAHEGVVKHKCFEHIEPYVICLMYADTMPSYINSNTIKTHDFFLDCELKKCRKDFLNEMEVYRYYSFLYTRCILCSLGCKFVKSINDDIKAKYSETIKKSIQIILEKRFCINIKYPNECPNSPSYK